VANEAIELKGRRCRMLAISPELLFELFKGGVLQISPALPADATPMGAWIDPRSYELQIAAHSNSFHLVRFGEPMPLIDPPDVQRL